MDKKAKRSASAIIILSWLCYAAAYIGRLNFNAYIEPIRDCLNSSKTEMGLVGSFFFFSYGAGQLIHGILSRKYNTRYSVAVALIGSALANVGMAVCPGVSAMKYVWLANGFFQAILWSSIIKTLSERLPDDMLHKAIVVMSTPPALGTFIIYGLSAVFASLKVDYRIIFYMPAGILAFAGILWFIMLKKTDAALKNSGAEAYVPEKKKRQPLTPAFALSAVFLVLAAIANGFIKDGVTTWTPSILRESYGMDKSLSILVTVILPLIAVLGATFSAFLHKKQNNTSLLNCSLYFAEVLILVPVIFLAKNTVTAGNPVFLIILFAFSAMMMSAVNNIITGIIPMYMRGTMDSGLLAGVLDTFCYVGSTLSTGLLGYIADKKSWNGVFICLLLFAAGACVVSFASVIAGRKHKENSQI